MSLREAPERVELARSLLERGSAVVLIDDQLALRRSGDRVLCEVIDPFVDGIRSAHRFEALIESAHALLDDSLLSRLVTGEELEWIVVADYGMGTVQLWPWK